MIDRVNRDKLAASCRHYMSGQINNFEFDEINFTLHSKDSAIQEIKYDLWCLYDELKQHKNEGDYKMKGENEAIVKRIILFLKTDQEYQWYKPNAIDKIKNYFAGLFRFKNYTKIIDTTKDGNREYWPFFSKEGYESALNEPKYFSKETEVENNKNEIN